MTKTHIALGNGVRSRCYHAIATRWPHGRFRTRCGKGSTRYVLIDFPVDMLVGDPIMHRTRPCKVCYPKGHTLQKEGDTPNA